MLFYVTLYSTKHNQKEESVTYHSICLALSKRIKNQQEAITHQSNNTEHTEEIAPDFCEGLKRMLSALYAHTAGVVQWDGRYFMKGQDLNFHIIQRPFPYLTLLNGQRVIAI